MTYIAYEGERFDQVAQRVYDSIEDEVLAWLIWNNPTVYEPLKEQQVIQVPPLEDVPNAGVLTYDVLTVPQNIQGSG